MCCFQFHTRLQFETPASHHIYVFDVGVWKVDTGRELWIA